MSIGRPLLYITPHTPSCTPHPLSCTLGGREGGRTSLELPLPHLSLSVSFLSGRFRLIWADLFLSCPAPRCQPLLGPCKARPQTTLVSFRELKYVIQRFAEDPRQEVRLLFLHGLIELSDLSWVATVSIQPLITVPLLWERCPGVCPVWFLFPGCMWA